MKHIKPVWINLVMVVLAAMLFAQCAPAAPAAVEATKAPAPVEATKAPAAVEATKAPAPAEKVKIVYWSMFSEGEPLMIVLDQATKDFMVEYPNIQVETKWAGREVLTQLQSAIAAGTQVDIVDHSDDRVLNALVKNGLALPMDKYLGEKAYDSDKTWGETYAPGVLDLGKFEGKSYLIPRDDYISAFFTNQAMLDAAGVTPKVSGMTWEEFNTMLETIKSKTPNAAMLGADGNVAFYNNWWFSYLAVRLAGTDGFRAAAYDKTGEKWGDPEFLQAAKMIRELQDKGYFQEGFEGSVWPAAQAKWVNGDIAMMFMGAWLPKEMSQQMPEGFKIGLFAFPDVAGGKGNGIVEHWSNAYGVLASTKNPDAVATYLKYIMSKKVGSKIAELGTPIPLEGVPVPASLVNQYEILKTAKAMPARAGLNTEIPEYMDTAFNVCDDKFFTKQLTPEAFITCLKTESKNYWAKK
jgi:raffinose/stachyose/melibiose transport system substrate-binding protein